MKHTFLLLAAIFIMSCSSDDSNCEGNATEINSHYDAQVQWVMDNPGPNGIDYRQIDNINAERNQKLQNACN